MAQHRSTLRAPRLRGMSRAPQHRAARPAPDVWYPSPAEWGRLAAGKSVKGVRLQDAQPPAPARPNVRQKAAQGGARANVSSRRGSFAAQVKRQPEDLWWRQPPPTPPGKPRGVARRPASPLPGDATPVAKGRRQPPGYGRDFSSSR